MLYRRFGTVFAHLLLNKQDEIAGLEKLLLSMDRTDFSEGNGRYLRSRTKDMNRGSLPGAFQERSRGSVMQELEIKLLGYSEYAQSKMKPPAAHPTPQPPRFSFVILTEIILGEPMLKAKELKALDCPSSKDYHSVLHFMENDGGQLGGNESAFVYKKADLVTLRPGRDHAWLDDVLERMLKAFRCRLTVVSAL